MQPKGGIFSPTQLHISVHYKMLKFLSCYENKTRSQKLNLDNKCFQQL